jgi:hypothetical protein
VTRTVEKVLDPVIGKSLVVYAEKPTVAGAPAARRWSAGSAGLDREPAAAR